MKNFANKLLILIHLFAFLSCLEQRDTKAQDVFNKNHKESLVHNKSTIDLAGVDENKNNIRDDFEQWVKKQKYKKIIKTHLLRYGYWHFKLLQSKRYQNKLHYFFKRQKSKKCVLGHSKTKESPFSDFKIIKKADSVLINTEPRLLFMTKMDTLLAGVVRKYRFGYKQDCKESLEEE